MQYKLGHIKPASSKISVTSILAAQVRSSFVAVAITFEARPQL